MSPTEFYHVALKADDVDETTAFYRDQFGAEVFDRGPPSDGDADGSTDDVGDDASSDENANAVEYAALTVADKRVYVFDEAPYEATGLVEEQPTGVLHFGFVVDDVAAAHAEMAESGVEFAMEPTDFGDLRIAFLLDPTGTWVELIEHRDRSV